MSLARPDTSSGSSSCAEGLSSLRVAPRAIPSPPNRLARRIASTLASDGVEVDGTAPHDIRVHDPRFFAAVAARGSLGLGESHREAWWECERLPDRRMVYSCARWRNARSLVVLSPRGRVGGYEARR